jgi:dTDP-4-dehydrorhamnose reductase
MEILVLGGEGMLGHKMFQLLRACYPDTACTIRGSLAEPPCARVPLFRGGAVIEKVDAMDLPALGVMLRDRKPRFLVNCIGIIKQRDEASAAIPSITINSLLPHKLAEFAAGWGGRVIHFSTDCVFDGKRGGYTEESPSDAADLYGKSKFLGEVAGGNALTLRTSIIGRELSHFRSLLEWFLAQGGQSVRGFTRVIYSGVTTNHLAGLVGDLIARQPDLAGLYQVSSRPISKHDLLCLLREAYRLDVEIIPDGGEVSDRSLSGERFRRATGYDCPEWPALVAQLAADPTPYRDWR